MTFGEDQLANLRAELDGLDEKLVALINVRAGIARRIGAIKAEAGMRVYAPDREKQVLEKICRHNQGPLTDDSLRAIYRELMSASLALERAPRIAVLGPEGSFSHLAGRRRFGSSVAFEVVATIADVFDAVEHGRVEFALVPVENSIAGGVGETLDALVERDVRVCGELHLAVHHHLLGTGSIEKLERVYSKPEVFAQCHLYLAATGLAGKTVGVGSTSAAAQRAAEEGEQTAAIAGDLAAELFRLPRLAEFIEDDRGNITRFLIIGRTAPKPTGSDKTSIAFSVGHEPGRLVETLDRFRAAGINMTRIESRPDRKQRWSYYFFVDLEGHADDAKLAACLTETARQCGYWKILGAYPRADEVL